MTNAERDALTAALIEWYGLDPKEDVDAALAEIEADMRAVHDMSGCDCGNDPDARQLMLRAIKAYEAAKKGKRSLQ